MADFSFIFIWWLTIFILGLITLPMTSLLFKRFADKGYIFSKVIGILTTSYLIWLFASIKILPFTKLSIILVLIFISLVNLFVFSKRLKNNGSKWPWGWMILEEVIFFLCLLFWSYVRANEPSIRGLEKFMDYGFVNSILRSNFFPPLDIWLAKSPEYTGGYFINYYYFGHFVTALLTKLSGINSAITYNLMIATLFAFTFALSFSLGANMVNLFLLAKTYASKKIQKILHDNPKLDIRLVIIGFFVAFLVALGGNLHTIYVFTEGYPNEEPKPFWTLQAGFHPERYWYPNATRFIPTTIHEFPIYSFVVADLHGHVSDIPFVLLSIAILMNLVFNKKFKDSQNSGGQDTNNKTRNFMEEFENHTSIPLHYVIILGILLAVMYMTNAWDGLIYMVLSGLTFLYINFTDKSGEKSTLLSKIYKTFSSSLFLLFFFLLASFPFTLNFKPFVSGIGVLCAPKFLLEKKIGPFLFETGKCQKSPLYMLSLLWGFFYFNVVGFFVFVVVKKIRNYMDSSPKIFKFKAVPSQIFTNLFKKIKLSLKALICSIGFLNPIDVFVLILIFISTLLLIFPEFFYIKDIYPAHYRANTMFKLGYQSFMMLGLACGYIIFRIKYFTSDKPKSISRILYYIFYVFLFSLVAIYPYFAINSYYNRLSKYIGLNGLLWMENQYPVDYQAIEWIRENITCQEGSSFCNNQPVIVEAVGESYTDYARVSAYTGLPTIVGWPVHEWLWRGSYDEAGKRIPEVATIYESEDINATKDLLKKYNAEYVYIGTLEKEKYPLLKEEKFDSLGKKIFDNGTAKIYKVTL